LDSLIRTILEKVHRLLVIGLLFWLPKERRKPIDRWLRGREEYRKLQQADAVIISFGKSGRTWLRVMISRLYSFKHGLKASSLMGFDNLHHKNKAIPKLFFSHDNYLKDYTGNVNNKADFYDSKVVLLVRDPLDVAVSQFFQWKFRMRPGKKALNDYPEHGADIGIYDFIMHPGVLLKIIDYLNLWADESTKIRELHIVRYEDMRTRTSEVLDGILRCFDTFATAAELDEAVNFSSIENMRKMENKRTFWLSGSRMVARDKSNPDSYKVRKAKVGGYRDYFDEDQIVSLEAIVNERLNPLYEQGSISYASRENPSGEQSLRTHYFDSLQAPTSVNGFKDAHLS